MRDFIGILSLDTAFPRILGDAGNPASYHLPARVRVVSGADSPLIVRDGQPTPQLIGAFIDAARQLEAEGACLITSTCGFLIQIQDKVAASVSIPVMLSSLSLLPTIRAMTGKGPIGVITASAPALGNAAITAARVPKEAVRIIGLQDSNLFSRTFLLPKRDQIRAFQPADMAAEVVSAAQILVTRSPEIAAILFECGNLPPYAKEVAQATGLPVFTMLDGARLILRH
ncbi:aspartate/glutamate racemase family protein [Paracoccus sp. JM45]|uniref:aspartate/glutamate racemase family protein n=1 Tax=Paracoccus sp. JM45 TaxID=2283626 RepID=UPI000E6BBB3A|nr:aspartate/glutamate racemase family protein [Paracoccus sp. JM45]RJE80097.1 aspartate/glutamate racemase family protein [Paracoccus sp. JM45]